MRCQARFDTSVPRQLLMGGFVFRPRLFPLVVFLHCGVLSLNRRNVYQLRWTPQQLGHVLC